MLPAIVRVIAIACAGVLAGIYLGYGAGPQYALQALSASNFVQFQQIVHVHYVTFMPRGDKPRLRGYTRPQWRRSPRRRR